MGIINATPDSFYQSHLILQREEILSLAKKMIEDGADILDVGGQSTRPGSKRINAVEEMNRIIPIISYIRAAYPEILISADTYYSEVAKAAIEEGADIINDISAGEFDHAMIKVIAYLKVPYLCMHIKGMPETMHENPQYEDVVKEVLDFFILKVNQCKNAGINDIIIDPGFGFGKNITHNFTLLKNLYVFNMLEKQVLAGLSRKSTIYKTLHITSDEALNGTTVMNTLAIQNGAAILRVHDVKEAKEVITLMDLYKKTLPFEERF